jgi:hypothetical protein
LENKKRGGRLIEERGAISFFQIKGITPLYTNIVIWKKLKAEG